ncbi:MAG: hypothetical protein Kow0010_13750 [Dehalococcoidia bacterium]
MSDRRTTQGAVWSLSPDTARDLRQRYPYERDEAWVLESAREDGWVTANRRFLQWHRQRGAEEMAALMRALHIERVTTAAQAAALLRLAYEVFMPPESFKGEVMRVGNDRVRIVVGTCPMFEKIQRSSWRGVTACGSWHHRRGWYDAMGVDAEDTVIAEQKWGEPSCVAEVAFSVPAA